MISSLLLLSMQNCAALAGCFLELLQRCTTELLRSLLREFCLQMLNKVQSCKTIAMLTFDGAESALIGCERIWKAHCWTRLAQSRAIHAAAPAYEDHVAISILSETAYLPKKATRPLASTNSGQPFSLTAYGSASHARAMAADASSVCKAPLP